MKKIAIVLLSLLLAACFSVNACAAVVTTSPKETTSASTAPSMGDGLVYESDITLPITVCIIAICAICVFGIVKIRQAGKDGLDK